MKKYLILIIIVILCLLYYLHDYYLLRDIYSCQKKFNSDKIYEYPNFLSDNECNKIIELSKKNIKRSTVITDESKEEISNVRTSSNTFLKNHIDPLLEKINNSINSITGINKGKYEDLQIVNYKPEQLYEAHWDACDPYYDKRCINDNKRGGLRFATFIIYLNDNFNEGETEFPLLNKKIKPEKGKAVLFFNLDNNLLKRKENSKHAGLPPKDGEKWMCNKWIRLNSFK
jgi:prolyl 4-hydroxylase